MQILWVDYNHSKKVIAHVSNFSNIKYYMEKGISINYTTNKIFNN